MELTEDETKQALDAVRKYKFEIQQQEAARKRREDAITEALRPWTGKEMYQQAEIRGMMYFGFSANSGADGLPVLEIDEETDRLFKLLSLYFTNNPKFEQTDQKYSLRKGLLVMGNVGRGKSLLMHLFARNKRQCYNVISCREIAAGYAKEGGGIIELHTKPTLDGGDIRTFYQKQRGVCYDDLGTEAEKKHFGNEISAMSEIILNRYDRKYEMQFDMTHITTNLSIAEIEQMYGTRVKSRLSEMFNQIIVTGVDRRAPIKSTPDANQEKDTH